MNCITAEQERQLRLRLMMVLQMAPLYVGKVDPDENSQLTQLVHELRTAVHLNGNSLARIYSLVRDSENRFPENGLVVSLRQVVGDDPGEGPRLDAERHALSEVPVPVS